MATFSEAPRYKSSPLVIEGIKSNLNHVLGKRAFVPVCQYPVDESYRPELQEVGMLAKLGRNGEILDVFQRIIQTRN